MSDILVTFLSYFPSLMKTVTPLGGWGLTSMRSRTRINLKKFL
jgi:hypothetical protein